jgi:hypothetical protein
MSEQFGYEDKQCTMRKVGGPMVGLDSLHQRLKEGFVTKRTTGHWGEDMYDMRW